MSTESQESNDRTQIAVIQSQLRSINEQRFPAVEESLKEVLRKMDNFTFVPMAVFDKIITDMRNEFKEALNAKAEKEDAANTKKLLYLLLAGIVGFFFYVLQLSVGH